MKNFNFSGLNLTTLIFYEYAIVARKIIATNHGMDNKLFDWLPNIDSCLSTGAFPNSYSLTRMKILSFIMALNNNMFTVKY